MDPARIARAADLLVDARRAHVRFRPPFALASRAEVDAVQDAVARRLGPVEGWKVGARTPEAEPNCAPILAGGLVDSPAVLPAAGFHEIGVEAEIAFRLGRDVPSCAAGALSDEAALAAIGSAHVAIEAVDSRIADWRSVDPAWVLADNQGNQALVLGAPLEGWRGRDWDVQAVRLTVDGVALDERVGGLPSRDPLRLALRLIRHAAERRGGMRRGQAITTGSWTGLRFVVPGVHVVAAFAGLGEAEIRFAAG